MVNQTWRFWTVWILFKKLQNRCFRKGGTLLILFKNHVKSLRRRGGGQDECQKFARYNCMCRSWITIKKVIFCGVFLTYPVWCPFWIENMLLLCWGMSTIWYQFWVSFNVLLSNMGAEVGASTSLFPFTSAMYDYLNATNRKEIAMVANFIFFKLRHLFECEQNSSQLQLS